MEGFCSIRAGEPFAGVSLILVVRRAVLIRKIQGKKPLRLMRETGKPNIIIKIMVEKVYSLEKC
ncbi:hypothetical protein [Methanothrix sp.]|uniref:hypothetical protein n=1 Tax=Methanothrix sp. TaxID=90426 RepID=UPI00345E5A3E